MSCDALFLYKTVNEATNLYAYCTASEKICLDRVITDAECSYHVSKVAKEAILLNGRVGLLSLTGNFFFSLFFFFGLEGVFLVVCGCVESESESMSMSQKPDSRVVSIDLHSK